MGINAGQQQHRDRLVSDAAEWLGLGQFPDSNSTDRQFPLSNAAADDAHPPPPPPPAGQAYNAANVYYGWHVLNIDSWIGEQGDQDRSKFLNELISWFQLPKYRKSHACPGGRRRRIRLTTSQSTRRLDAYEHIRVLPPVVLNGGVDGTLKLQFDSGFGLRVPRMAYRPVRSM